MTGSTASPPSDPGQAAEPAPAGRVEPATAEVRSGANGWEPRARTEGTDLAEAYVRHSGQLRGALRHALVSRALLLHLPPGPQRVLDVGGGAGHQAIALARAGHHITVLDPDPTMLDRAQTALDTETDDVRKRIQLQQGPGEDALLLVGGGYDAVCCHGVLMYLDDPAAFLATMTAAARPGGLVSVLTKNAAAQAMRPGLEGRYADALDLLRHAPSTSVETDPASGDDGIPELGRLGIVSRAHTQVQITAALRRAGAATLAWYGVRVFTDHLRDVAVGSDFDLAVEAEWSAGARDPYRQLARLIHVIARTGPLPGPQSGPRPGSQPDLPTASSSGSATLKGRAPQ